METLKTGPRALDYCIEAETAGRIPVLNRLEPTSPPGELGALCEIGYDGDKYVARVVDAISEADYITANRDEFWKLPPSLTTALEAKRARVEALLAKVGGRLLPNVRYEKSKLNKEIAERVRLYNASEVDDVDPVVTNDVEPVFKANVIKRKNIPNKPASKANTSRTKAATMKQKGVVQQKRNKAQIGKNNRTSAKPKPQQKKKIVEQVQSSEDEAMFIPDPLESSLVVPVQHIRTGNSSLKRRGPGGSSQHQRKKRMRKTGPEIVSSESGSDSPPVNAPACNRFGSIAVTSTSDDATRQLSIEELESSDSDADDCLSLSKVRQRLVNTSRSECLVQEDSTPPVNAPACNRFGSIAVTSTSDDTMRQLSIDELESSDSDADDCLPLSEVRQRLANTSRSERLVQEDSTPPVNAPACNRFGSIAVTSTSDDTMMQRRLSFSGCSERQQDEIPSELPMPDLGRLLMAPVKYSNGWGVALYRVHRVHLEDSTISVIPYLTACLQTDRRCLSKRWWVEPSRKPLEDRLQLDCVSIVFPSLTKTKMLPAHVRRRMGYCRFHT
jgi:hypothetical protein